MTHGDDHIKKIVNGILIYWIATVITGWITFWVKGSIPDTLIQYSLGGTSFELLCTTVLEIVKKIKDN